MTVVVGGFAIVLGILVLLFAKRVVAAGERTRINDSRGDGERRGDAGWQSFSMLMTRLAGVCFIVVGILVLTNVLHLR